MQILKGGCKLLTSTVYRSTMVLPSLYHGNTTVLSCRDLLFSFNMCFSVSSGLLMMSTFPSSSSKSLTSTPLKSRPSVPSSVLQRSRSLESTGDSTSSLLSPIYHDSFELSEEDQPQPVHNITVTSSEDVAPGSPSPYRWAVLSKNNTDLHYNKLASLVIKSNLFVGMRWTQQAWTTDRRVCSSIWVLGSSGLWIKPKRSVLESNKKLWRYMHCCKHILCQYHYFQHFF